MPKTISLKEPVGKIKVKKQVETNRWDIGHIDDLEIVRCVRVKWVDRKKGITYESLEDVETILGCDVEGAILTELYK